MPRRSPYLLTVQRRLDIAGASPCYSLSLPAMQKFRKLDLHHSVTFFCGENGSGKSTLLEAIAIAFGFNPEGGSRNFNFSTSDTHSRLHEYLRLARSAYRPADGFFLRAESFYNTASEVDRLQNTEPGDFYAQFGGKSLHAQSHGESFLSLVLNRFRGGGFYLLDEPEAALSIRSQLILLSKIGELVNQQDSQFIIATHSLILMAFPNACIYHFDEQGIRSIAYQDTDSYFLTKAFLDAPERMLREMLD